jgi:shikimate kinase
LSSSPKRNIALTGFMAVGKSAVARRLARRLKRPFIDLDRAIAKAEGLTVREIFERKGEPYFRALEKRMLQEALSEDGQVIATGGGAVVDAENLRLLKERSVLICLTAPPETLLSRSGSGKGRPLLGGQDRRRRIAELLRQREASYAQAHSHIDTARLTVDEVVEKILAFLKSEG